MHFELKEKSLSETEKLCVFHSAIKKSPKSNSPGIKFGTTINLQHNQSFVDNHSFSFEPQQIHAGFDMVNIVFYIHRFEF